MDIDSELEVVRTIPHLLALASSRFGVRSAIEDEGDALSFVGLEQAAVGIAKALIANGIAHGDRVAVWAPNSARWIIAALGAQMAGALLVPVNTRLKGREAGFILRRSGARILFTVTEFLGINYPELLHEENLPQLERIVRLSGPGENTSWSAFVNSGAFVTEAAVCRRLAELKEFDYSDLIFTSGTTGTPKGVMTNHGQNLEMFRIYSRLLGLRADDRFLMVNPYFNTFGYKAGWLSALMRGATILPQAVFDAAAVLQRIERDRVTVLPGPPTLYQSLLAEPNLHKFDLRSLRLAITGAATIPVDLIRRMQSDLGFDTVLTAYGLTETCGLVSMCSAEDDAQTNAATAGRAVPGVEVRVVDDADKDLAPGLPGEILVRGRNVMQGYFEDAEETARVIDAQGWLRTGDIGVVNEAGYVTITDRKKDLFIVGGFNCYPAEIEHLLLANTGIAMAAVVGVPDERLGQVAKAFVVLKLGATLTAEDITAWSRKHMANYKVPRVVEIVESLPMNASGKIQRFALRDGAQRGS